MPRHRTDRARGPGAPTPERLEARALLAKTPATIMFQVLPRNDGSNDFELLITGTSKNDAITIVDNGTDAAGNISVTTGSGLSFTSQQVITDVRAVTGKGNDRVTYELTGNLKAGVHEDVIAASAGSALGVAGTTGGGNLQFVVDLAGKVSKDAELLAFAAADPKGKTAITFSDSSEIDGEVGVDVFSSGGSSNKNTGPVSLSLNSTSTIGIDGSLGFDTLVRASQTAVSATYVGRLIGEITSR